MSVRTLSRIFSFTAAWKVLQHPPQGCPSLLAPSSGLNMSLLPLPHHTCWPQSLLRLLGKGKMDLRQMGPALRVKSAETHCHTIVSYRQAGKNLLQSIHRATRQAGRHSVKRGTRAWWSTPLGMAFLAPSVAYESKKEVPASPVQPEVKRRERGWWSQLLLNVYELISVCLRAVRLLATFTPIILLYPITYCGTTATDIWWGLLLTAIELSGPILIKLGQWASTRRDLLPDSCCSQFSRLQRRVKPHSWHFTALQMKRAFGPNWRKVFVKFDNEGNPIGSGCVAQVYKVWMSTEAIPDEELLEEILSGMDEDNNIMEGLEVMGFSHLVGMGLGLLGLGSKTNPDNPNALKDSQQQRDERRSISSERPRLLEQEAAQDTHEYSAVEGAAAGTEAAQKLLSGGRESDSSPSEGGRVGLSPEDTGEVHSQEVEDVEDAPAHSLVEEWQEAELDKSLPVCEAPPEDLEGLVPVAVKVLHPGMAAAFRRDLRILRACASIVTTLIPPLRWLSLPQCVDEFAHVMAAQINLKTEADNLEKFSENFSDVPFIKFPRPLRPYVTHKVLVETFEEGEPMLEVLRATEDSDTDLLKRRLAEIGVDALLKMVFVDNLVHGDLHPGNMLVQNITSGAASGDQVRVMMVDIGCDTFVMDVQPDPNPLRICFLDCGITSRLNWQNLANIRAVFKQVVLGDGESVAELFLEHSEHQCADPQAFREEVDDLVQAARESTVSLSQVDVGVLLQQVLSVLLKHKVRLESAFSAVVLAVFVLEGLGRALDPNMDILERARPILVTSALP